MIRKITIGILNLVILYLPPKKRQAKRVAWLQALMQPYADMEAIWYPWRDSMIVRAGVTGQVQSLQWYLNQLFDAALQRILILEAVAGGTYLSLESEGVHYLTLGLEGVGGEPDGALLYLEGENSSSLPYNFRVLCPAAVDVTQLKAVVDLYNMRHASYDVVTF